MNTDDARTLLKMMAECSAINTGQHNVMVSKLNEMDAEEARHNMALDREFDKERFG